MGVFDKIKGAIRDNQGQTVSCTLEGLTVALIRHAEIHEGWWQLTFTFKNSATNMNRQEPGGPAMLTPCNVSFITGAGLMRVEEPNGLSVNAAIVNPRQRIIMPDDVASPRNGKPH